MWHLLRAIKRELPVLISRSSIHTCPIYTHLPVKSGPSITQLILNHKYLIFDTAIGNRTAFTAVLAIVGRFWRGGP